VGVELDPGQFVIRPQGCRAWVREERRALEAEREARPIAKDRTDRLFEACRRLEEELEHASHAAYDAWRARGIAADGSRRMAPRMVKPHEPVLVPTGLMNVSDHDSRPMRTHGCAPLRATTPSWAVKEQQVVCSSGAANSSASSVSLLPFTDMNSSAGIGSARAKRSASSWS
jgi:hypothetical protein